LKIDVAGGKLYSAVSVVVAEASSSDVTVTKTIIARPRPTPHTSRAAPSGERIIAKIPQCNLPHLVRQY